MITLDFVFGLNSHKAKTYLIIFHLESSDYGDWIFAQKHFSSQLCEPVYSQKNVFTWVCYLHESAIILQSLSETDPLV